MQWLSPTRIIAAAVVLILLLGFLQVRSCTQARQKATQAKLERGQAKAGQESAKDAIATQEAAAARERASEGQAAANSREIRNAEGADVKINPAVSAAALRVLCARAAYRDTERCRLFRANPK